MLYNYFELPLAALATLLIIADVKLNQVKDNSVKDAKATPPITGNSDKYTGIGRNCFNTTADKNADTAGSAAFTIWVKLTAPAPKETTAPKWVNVCKTATGNKDFISSLFSSGALRIPKPIAYI